MGDFKTSILKFIISQIWGKQKFNWVGHIMRAAINMVQYGAIQCLRDFEDYVVGLTKVSTRCLSIISNVAANMSPL